MVLLGCVWFPVKVGWDMAVHILLDMAIQFFVWWSEYGDPVFCLVVGMKVDLVIHFFFGSSFDFIKPFEQELKKD